MSVRLSAADSVWQEAAAGAVGGELGLMQLDQVLGLAAGAIKVGIKPFGRPARDVGDDVADVETEPRRLDAGCDAALSRPGLGGVGGLGEATHGLLVFDGALDADRVGELVDLGRKGARLSCRSYPSRMALFRIVLNGC